MRNTRNGFTKIGISKNPNFREKTLQAEEPEIELIYEWAAPPFVERYLHAYYGDKRIRGEWFALNLRDIAGFYIQVEDGIAFGPEFRATFPQGGTNGY